jgi:release factor glutamine methyltransferase
MPDVQAELRRLTARLAAAGLDQPAREARLLMAAALEVAPGRLTLYMPDPLPEAARARARTLAERRAAGEPVSHLLGFREFYGRRFAVDGRVLDPRPETEVLVVEALRHDFAEVLDLGTGSGCILVTLLAERPGARGLGVDASPEALEVARANAAALGAAGRCDLRVSDWYAEVAGRFDLIVSNPPYISEAEMPGLAPEVRGHDPHMALTPGGDGLDPYRVIAAGAGDHLAPGGRLLVEIGSGQGADVQAIFAAAGLEDVRCHPDMDGRDRLVGAVAPTP